MVWSLTEKNVTRKKFNRKVRKVIRKVTQCFKLYFSRRPSRITQRALRLI